MLIGKKKERHGDRWSRGEREKVRKEWARERRRIHYVRRRESFRIVCRVDRPPP